MKPEEIQVGHCYITRYGECGTQVAFVIRKSKKSISCQRWLRSSRRWTETVYLLPGAFISEATLMQLTCFGISRIPTLPPRSVVTPLKGEHHVTKV